MNNTTESDSVLSPVQNMCYALVYLLVGIIGTFGNGCIIYLFLRYKDLRKKEGLFTYVCCDVAAFFQHHQNESSSATFTRLVFHDTASDCGLHRLHCFS